MRVSCRAVGSQLCVRSMALACKDFMSRATNPTKWIQTFSTCSTQIMHCKVASNSCHSLLHLPIVWVWLKQFYRWGCVCGFVHSLIVFCCFVWHHFLLKWLMTNSGIWFFLSPIRDCTRGLIDPRQLYSQLRVSNLAWKAAFRAVMVTAFLMTHVDRDLKGLCERTWWMAGFVIHPSFWIAEKSCLGFW